MTRIKYLALLLFAVLPADSAAVSRELTEEDYLCSIFPPACPKISRSTSTEFVHINLERSSLGKKTKTDSIPTIPIAVHRAFIDWLPYLKPVPQTRVAIEAAIPDFSAPVLIPETIWKQSFSNAPHLAGAPALDSTQAHRHWLHIELSLAPDITNIDCGENYCPSTINEKVRKLRDSDFIFQSVKSNQFLERYTPKARTTPYYEYEYKELIVVRDSTGGIMTFMICDIAAENMFNWCKATSQLQPGIDLNYNFESSFLDHYAQIDKAVRSFSTEAFKRGASDK